MKKFPVAIGAAAISLLAAQAMAASSQADEDFAAKAAAGGQAEVALGRLAASTAESPQVRVFGQRMAADHTEADQALREIARKQEMTLPDQPAAADQATERRLRTLKGQAFDAAYMRDMVQDHRQDVAEFRREAENGRDPALKAFALKYLPVLEQHLQMAENLAPR